MIELDNDKLFNAVQVIKDAILQSQQRALKLVNQEQLALYFGVGRYISSNTRTKNWGKGFIEIHHEKPICQYDENGTEVFISEAIKYVKPLCANCHRMIHRKKNNPITIDELKNIIKKPSSK